MKRNEFEKKIVNTGCTENQIIIFNKNIDNIKNHIKDNKKDYLAKKGLKKFLKKRKVLILYIDRYNKSKIRK